MNLNIVRLCILAAVLLASPCLHAQDGILWSWRSESTAYGLYLVGARNMDEDPQEELVFFNKLSSYPGPNRIFIIDGATGNLDWDSGVAPI